MLNRVQIEYLRIYSTALYAVFLITALATYNIWLRLTSYKRVPCLFIVSDMQLDLFVLLENIPTLSGAFLPISQNKTTFLPPPYLQKALEYFNLI